MAGKRDRTGELDGNGNGQFIFIGILRASNANIEWCFRYLHLLYCLYLLISDAHTNTESDTKSNIHTDTKSNIHTKPDTHADAEPNAKSHPRHSTGAGYLPTAKSGAVGNGIKRKHLGS